MLQINDKKHLDVEKKIKINVKMFQKTSNLQS